MKGNYWKKLNFVDMSCIIETSEFIFYILKFESGLVRILHLPGVWKIFYVIRF